MSSLAKHSALEANMDNVWGQKRRGDQVEDTCTHKLSCFHTPARSVPIIIWAQIGLRMGRCWRGNMTFIHLRLILIQIKCQSGGKKNTGYAPCTGVKLSANFSESRTGLQAAWILCLSVLPPDLDFQMKCKMYFYLKRGLWTTEQQ